MWLHLIAEAARRPGRGSYSLAFSFPLPREEDGDIADYVTDNHKRATNECLARPRMKETSTGTRRSGGRRVAVDDEVFFALRVDACKRYGSSDGLALISPCVESQCVKEARRRRAERPRKSEMEMMRSLIRQFKSHRGTRSASVARVAVGDCRF